jgi:hypothetical protein
MFSKILFWINERWPLNRLIRLSLDEEMPESVSISRGLLQTKRGLVINEKNKNEV